jgi:hypothetical protein
MGSASRIVGTPHFQDVFKRTIVDGSCNGVDLIGAAYFQQRRAVEVRNPQTLWSDLVH